MANKKMTKKMIKVIALYVLGAVVAFQGIALGLYMYFSTFMPGNPWRKCFYGVAFLDLALAIFFFAAAYKAQQIITRKRRRG